MKGEDNDESQQQQESINNSNDDCSADVAAPSLQPLVVCTRIHLGKASSAPNPSKLQDTIVSFLNVATSCGAIRAAIAVDDSEESRIPGYDLPEQVASICEAECAKRRKSKTAEEISSARSSSSCGGEHELWQLRRQEYCPPVDIVRVSPWGQFIAALNALVTWSARYASLLLLVSAETSFTSPSSLKLMRRHMNMDTTLVVGPALPGHDYRGARRCDTAMDGADNCCDEKVGSVTSKSTHYKYKYNRVELTGRTTPWNTAALWNIPKLALLGFPLVAEGLHHHDNDNNDNVIAGGVEEVSTIAILQHLIGENQAEAKLIKLPTTTTTKAATTATTNNDNHNHDGGVVWDQEWEDNERQKWHIEKMKSKITRPAKHLDLLCGLKGTVLHC